MSSNSVVPRGFSKFYVLSLLKERPMTGKEIMEETSKRTEGSWKPSPGLVYPLLGKLLSSGLIEEVEEGRGYRITKSGEDLLSQYQVGHNELDNLYATLARLGMFGQLMAKDAVDRMTAVMKTFREDFSKLGKVQKAKYRKFLQSEIERLDRSEQKSEPVAAQSS
ncbi:MAG: PadR family transcriptional regulator [Nitrososphaerota archaeon]|nr:PadR family transcriptional regulator [Nitrososphaerota archaeon]